MGPDNLTPNPFPSGKGNLIVGRNLFASGKGLGSTVHRGLIIEKGERNTHKATDTARVSNIRCSAKHLISVSTE